MSDFDYVKARKELVEPLMSDIMSTVAFSLHLDKALGFIVMDAEGLSQRSDLQMPWPESDRLRREMEEMSTLQLALSAAVIWRMGHWGDRGEPLQEGGVYWKYARYADQIIAEGLDLDFEHGRGRANYAEPGVDDGELRIYLGLYDDSYRFEVLGLATEQNLTILKSFLPALWLVTPGGRLRRRPLPDRVDKVYEQFDFLVRNVREDIQAHGDSPDGVAEMLNPGPMYHK